MAQEEKIFRIAQRFLEEGSVESAAPHGSGHINDTYLLVCKTNDGYKKYTMQRINHEVFKKPWELMENVVNVTEFLQKKIAEAGGDAARETLHVVPAKDGASYCGRTALTGGCMSLLTGRPVMTR